MSSWLVTLASAAGGGVLAMAATTVTDHLRWKRDRAEQWSAKRFEAYREFMNVMHVQVGAARSLATTHGLLDGPPPVSEDEGVREIAESDRTLALAYETVQLLGNERTGSAAHAWRAAVWQLSDYARGELPADRNDWAIAYTTYREARDTFQAAVRGDLGIEGPGFQRRHQTTPAEPGGVRQTS